MIESALEKVCKPGLVPGPDQMDTNDFGMHLAWAWATDGLKGPKSNVHLYAAPHVMPGGRSHVSAIQNVIKKQYAWTNRPSL